MKKSILFCFILVICVCQGCKDDNVIYGGSLRFDKETVSVEADASSTTVAVLDSKGKKNVPNAGWGVSSILIETIKGETRFNNTFELESNGKDIYNVYINPVVGDWFSVLVTQKGGD